MEVINLLKGREDGFRARVVFLKEGCNGFLYQFDNLNIYIYLFIYIICIYVYTVYLQICPFFERGCGFKEWNVLN